LRIPRVPRLGHERLRAALEQRAEQWKTELRAEPRIGRLMLRRLVGPLMLWDEAERPEWCQWKAAPATELLDGLATLEGTSPRGTGRTGKSDFGRDSRGVTAYNFARVA